MNRNRTSTYFEQHHAGRVFAGEGGVDVVLWMCVAAVLLGAYIYPTFTPTLEHDSFQYLSAADNLLRGHLGFTSIVHFDAERSFGLMPAPMVTFPIGYAVAIVLASQTGMSLEGAASLLSAVSTVACVPLLAWIGGQLRLSRLLRNVVVACFVFNGVVIQFGTTVLTEAVFTFVILVGVALLIGARHRDDRSRWWFWIGAGLAFGAAYFVRYSGLFFIGALALLAVRHALASNRALAIGHCVSLAVASAAVMAGVARNMLLVGNWRGRDEMIVNGSIPSTLLKTGQAANVFFLGPGTSTPGGVLVPKALLASILIAGFAWLIFGYLRRRSLPDAGPAVTRGAGIDLLVLAASYAACMFYAGLTSAISYGTPRNFVPLMPLFVLMFGLLLQTLLKSQTASTQSRRVLPLVVLAGIGLYAYLNLLVFRLQPVDHAAAVARQMDAIGPDGTSARAVIQSNVGPRGVIIANNGQAIGHVLMRPTVSLVGPHYSNVEWNEKTMRDTVRRFNAQAIVIAVPKGEQADKSDLIPSVFVRQLAQGEPPAWMSLVHRSGDLMVYVPDRTTP